MKKKSFITLLTTLTDSHRRAGLASDFACRRAAFLLAGILAALGAAQHAPAANKYFDTSGAAGLQGGTATWDNGITQAWDLATTGIAPTTWATGDAALIQTGTASTLNIEAGGVSAISLAASGTGTNATVNGSGTLTLTGTGGFTNNTSNLLTVNAPISSSTSAVNLAGTGDLLFTGLWSINAIATAQGITPAGIGGTRTFSATSEISLFDTTLGFFTLLGGGTGNTTYFNGVIRDSLTPGNTSANIAGAVTLNTNGTGSRFIFNGANTFTLTGALPPTVSLGGNNGGLNSLGNNAPFGNAANILNLNQTKFEAFGGPRTIANPPRIGGGPNSFVGTNDLTFSSTGITSAANALYNNGTARLIFNNPVAFNPTNTTTLGGSGQTELQGALAGTVALNINGTGTGRVILSGTNTHSSSTTINGGSLVLDYGTNDTTKLANAGAINLNGGRIVLAGATGSHLEVTGALTLGTGTNGSTNSIARSGTNTARLQTGTINRAAGNAASLDFQTIGGTTASTSSTNTNDILGGWATTDRANWALNSTNTANGSVVALGFYQLNINTAAATDNVALTNTATAMAGPVTANTLKVTTTGGGGSLNLGSATLSLNSAGAGGILFTGDSAYTITKGSLATTSGGLIFHQNATLPVSIEATILNRLIKTGSGILDLSGNATGNLYTGQTVISEGTLVINNDNQLGDPANGISLNNGTLRSTGAAVNLGTTRDIVISSAGGTLDVTAGNTLTVGGIISGGASGLIGLTKTGPGILELTGLSTYSGSTRILGGTITANTVAAFNVASAIGNGNQNAPQNLVLDGGTLSFVGTAAGASSRAFHLGAAGGTLDGSGTAALTWSGAPVGDVPDTARSLTLGGTYTAGTTGNIFSASITDNGTAPVSLTKTGPGFWTLSVTQTYSGNTTVNQGTLALAIINPKSPASTVTIAATGATLSLTFTGTGVVNKLFIGATQMAAGIYKAPGSPATGTELPQLSGTGTLTVLSSPGVGGYTAWQSSNGTTQNADGDHDGDGVKNGIEYFLGGTASTTGFTPLPGIVPAGGTFSITWTKAATYTGPYGTGFLVETSPTLSGVWSPATLGGSVTLTGNDLKFTFPAGSINFARLRVFAP